MHAMHRPQLGSRLLLLLSLCVGWAPVAAWAQDEVAPAPEPAAPDADAAAIEPPPPSLFAAGWFGAPWDVSFSVGGSYRVSAEGLTDMRVDADGRLYEQNALVSHRLRWQPGVRLGDNIAVEAELQLFSGHLYHDDVNARLDGFGPPRGAGGQAFASLDAYPEELALRKLYLTWTTPIGQLRVGRQAFQWGMGILANSGENETQDWGAPRFGEDRDYGDIVDRILFVTAPLAAISGGEGSEWARRWLLAFGGDVVVRDERIVRDMGDLALQAVGALRYAEEDPTTGITDKELGVFVAHRHLNDRNQDTLTVTAFDLFGRGVWRWDDVELSGAGEVVWVVGDTTLAQNNAFLNTKVQQLGWLARLGATYLPWGLGGDVEVGYASGDSNPNDEFLRNFSFDPDYNPSLILFDQLQAAQTVAAAANASDPSKVGVPPSAARLLPTGGAMTNAVYVRPTVRFAWEGLAARFAFLWAMAPQDIVDPYNSNAIGGGTAVNYQGGNGGQRDLGFELDLGVDYTYQWDHWLEVNAGLQGGYLFPGSGFADAAGITPDPIGMVFGRLIFRWLPADPKGPPRRPNQLAPTKS